MKKTILSLFIISTFMLMGCANAEDLPQSLPYPDPEPQASVSVSVPDLPPAPVSISISEEPEIEEFVPPSLSLVMVGDMLLHDRLEDYATIEKGVYDYSSFFTHTKDLISEADVAIVNQEVILGGDSLGISGYPAFNAPYEFGDELVATGFDVVLHATNHALDKRKTGLMNCIDYWESNHPEILVTGINKSRDDYDNISVYHTDDFDIAILNYTYSTNGISAPEDMPFAVNMLDKEKVIADIKWAEENTDFTIVCPHWGTEYSLSVSSYQKKWTNIFLENGVDLVIGTHPHVIEPVEWLENEETGEKMLVYYSLGNFINWTGSTGAGCADRMVGGMASVTLNKTEEGKVFIAQDTVIPLICHLSKEEGALSVYPLPDYTPLLANENLARNIDSAFSYDYCVNLVDKVWGDYYSLSEIE